MDKAPYRTLDHKALAAVRDFLDRLKGRYEVEDALVFGSRARGEAGPDSDIDVAVVLADDVKDTLEADLEMARIAFDTMMTTGELIEALPLRRSEFMGGAAYPNPFLIAAIRRDGISALTLVPA